MTNAVKDNGLIIRHAERKTVELPAELVISDAHARQVHFSATSEAIAPNHIPCKAVDVSTGGVGVETRHFLPRQTAGIIRIFRRGNDAGQKRELLLEHEVKVRRVEMIDRDPQYALGLAFTQRTPELEKCVALIADHLQEEVDHA